MQLESLYLEILHISSEFGTVLRMSLMNSIQK